MNLSVTLDVNESSLVHLVQVTSVLDGRKGTIRNDSNKRWLCFEWKRVSKWILGNPTKFHPQVERKVARNRGVEFNFRPVGGQRAKKNERDGHKVELQFEYDETVRKNDQDPRNRIILYRRWQSKDILIIFIGNKR